MRLPADSPKVIAQVLEPVVVGSIPDELADLAVGCGFDAEDVE